MESEKVERIGRELKAAGVGKLSVLGPQSKSLARMLHDNEHIGGVVYGAYAGGYGWLIATDTRVLFIDKKPLFSSTDELSYDVVSGVRRIKAAVSASVTLHTRVGDYTVRYVSDKCAITFVRFIESKIESNPNPTQDNTQPAVISDIDGEALSFLKSNDLGVLSTIDRTGNVHGAVVYFAVDQYNSIYILTKSGTGKGRNVYAHGQVALTIHEIDTMKTVQIQGIASIVTDQKIQDLVFSRLTKPREYQGEIHSPPVTKIHEGEYMVIKITPSFVSYHDYSKDD